MWRSERLLLTYRSTSAQQHKKMKPNETPLALDMFCTQQWHLNALNKTVSEQHYQQMSQCQLSSAHYRALHSTLTIEHIFENLTYGGMTNIFIHLEQFLQVYKSVILNCRIFQAEPFHLLHDFNIHYHDGNCFLISSSREPALSFYEFSQDFNQFGSWNKASPHLYTFEEIVAMFKDNRIANITTANTHRIPESTLCELTLYSHTPLTDMPLNLTFENLESTLCSLRLCMCLVNIQILWKLPNQIYARIVFMCLVFFTTDDPCAGFDEKTAIHINKTLTIDKTYDPVVLFGLGGQIADIFIPTIFASDILNFISSFRTGIHIGTKSTKIDMGVIIDGYNLGYIINDDKKMYNVQDMRFIEWTLKNDNYDVIETIHQNSVS